VGTPPLLTARATARATARPRRGRELEQEDLTHYQRIVVALSRTMEIMAEIDARIEEWPIE